MTSDDMLRLALKVGLTVEQYLDSTPRALQIAIEVYTENLKKERRSTITNAWLTALWSRVEKLPSLEEVLSEQSEEKKNKEVNYQKIARLARERGIKLPQSFIAERSEYGD